MLLIFIPKTISIIGATMFNIVATMILIVLTKIGVVFIAPFLSIENRFSRSTQRHIFRLRKPTAGAIFAPL